MLTRHRRRPPAGYTLTELIVAMTVGGLVLAILAATAAHQQRALGDLADYAAVGQQIQDARAILASGLRGLTPADGDIRDARDTAIELRSTIAAGVVCDTTGNTILLSPPSAAAAGVPTFTSVSQSIEAGDSAWALTPSGSSESWTPARITYVATSPGRQCATLGPILDASQLAKQRIALTLSPPLQAAVGVPVRITRPVRYSVYRASDNLWYLGERDWNNAGAYLDIVQPVAGPFLPPAQNGLRFTYLDTSGATIATPVAAPRSIASIRIDIHGQTRSPRRTLGAASDRSRRTDSAAIVISLRNR